MFNSFNVWLLAMDDGSIWVYVEQYGKVYTLSFASPQAARDFLKPCNDFLDRLYPEPKLSQNIIEYINSL